MGKRYQVSFKKLFGAKTFQGKQMKELKDNTPIVFDKEVQKYSQTESFFCSELIAAIFKIGGFLGSEKTSGRYFPGSFSSKKNLSLKKGASLSNEYYLLLSNVK